MDWGVVEDDEISTFKLKKETLKSTERERERVMKLEIAYLVMVTTP